MRIAAGTCRSAITLAVAAALIPWTLAASCDPQTVPDNRTQTNANSDTTGNANRHFNGSGSANDPQFVRPANPSLPPGWEFETRVPATGPNSEAYVIFAAFGPTVKEALDEARAQASKSRETHVDSTTRQEFLSVLDSRTGQLVETMSIGSTTLSRTNTAIREASLFGQPVEQVLRNSTVVWVRVRVSEFDLFPFRSLREVIARRPSPAVPASPTAAETAKLDAWHQQLRSLADQYLAQGEATFGIAAMATLARDLGTVAGYLDLARLAIQHHLLGTAKRTLEIAATLPGADTNTELPNLRRAVREECAKGWDALLRELGALSRERRNDRILSLKKLGEPKQLREAPIQLQLYSDTPRHVILLWLDSVGLFRWPWEVEPGAIHGMQSIGNDSGSSVAGAVMILAVATDVPTVDRDFVPATGLIRQKLEDGDTDTLERVEAFIKYLKDLVGRPTTAVGACEFDLE